jgi:small conductance mechanosensitive channel
MKDFSDIISNFSTQMNESIQNFIEKTPNIILAFLVVIIGYYIAQIVGKSIVKLLHKREIKPSARNMIGNITFLFVLMVFFLMSLNILNLDTMLKTMLAGAGVAGLAIGLALQNTLSNTFSGVALSFIKDLKIGDQIQTNGFTGEIEDINLRVIKLKTNDDNYVVIPNKMIIENPLKNYSYSLIARVFVNCGVAYNSNLAQVRELVIKAIKEMMAKKNFKTDINFFYKEFAGSSIDFEIRFTAPSKKISETLEIKSEAIMAIKKTFDENNITIPFPIRTLDIPEGTIHQLTSSNTTQSESND